jgi:histidine ammonia-lyase
MIAQYSAASMASQNKQLCTPASVDTIMSSNGQEDHVSMGANAAIKSLKVAENVVSVLGIELLCACQAANFRKENSFPKAELVDQEMGVSATLHMHIPMHELIAKAASWMKS